MTRILVDEFPMYFAVVTQLRRDSEVLGEVGGVINSTVEPRVEAVIPQRAFRKNVRLSLQVIDEFRYAIRLARWCNG